jgi:hypothetical protein
MDKTMDAIKDFSQDIGDALIYALNPTTGMNYLHKKYGAEDPPEKP